MFRIPDKAVGYTIGVLLICLCINLPVAGQKLELFFGPGYASYSQGELKAFQRYYIKQSGVKMTVAEKFPAYVTYLAGANLSMNKWTFGFEFGHGSTGGRVYYEDYSGKLISDLVIVYNSMGVKTSFVVKQSEKFSMSMGAKFLFSPSKLTFSNTATIGSDTDTETYVLKGTNFGFQPGVNFRRYFGPTFLDLGAGYEFQNKQLPETDDANKLHLVGENNKNVRMQGSGFRLNLCFGIRIGKH